MAQPPKPIDPKDPSTWPKKSSSDLAAAQARAGYQPMTGRSTGRNVQRDTNMYNAGIGDVLRGAGNALVGAGDMVFKEPAKSVGRTLSTRNIQTALNPRSSWQQRAGALAEDALNIASLSPAMRAGAAYADGAMRNYALKKAIKGYVPEQLYEYGIHTSSRPNIQGFIDTDILKNRGGAGDALPGYAYQWRLSDPRMNPPTRELLKQGAEDAYKWSDRLETWQLIDNDNITSYLTRANPRGIINDQNLDSTLVSGRNRGAAVPSRLEILDRATVGNMSNPEDQVIYRSALDQMVGRYGRRIGVNNRRLQSYYQRNPGELLP